MAYRGRSAAAHATSEHSYDSSPDPLALSTNENKVKAWRKTPQKQPFTATSPGKQNRRLSFSEADFSSPAKSMVMSTPRTANASPWRIRVTVQAEPGSDEENGSSPTVKRVTKTKTTTVPLKDPDAESPVKRPRGRPRKSDVGVATKPKRNGTPAKKTARSRSREAQTITAESSAADGDADVPVKKRRGRPRKSIQPHVEDEPTINIEGLEISSAKKTTENTLQQSKASDKNKNAFVAIHEVPVLDTPPRTELGDQLRARKGTPHARRVIPVDILSEEESGETSDVLTPSSDEDDFESHKTPAPQSVFGNERAVINKSVTRSVSEQEEENFVAVDENVAEVEMQEFEDGDDFESPEFAFEDGATRMLDDTTVLDSMNFTMISVDSLPSTKGSTSRPMIGVMQSTVEPSIKFALHQHDQSLPTNALQGSSIGATEQHRLAAAHNTHELEAIASSSSTERHKTPVIDTEVPSMPPPITQSQHVSPEAETPQIGRVVTAGVALQGVLDPTRLTPQPLPNSLTQKHDELDDLFRGFSEGTRKELQSNLRFGEQLAQEEVIEPSIVPRSSPSKEPHRSEKKEGVFRTQRKYRQSRLLTPEEQDDYAPIVAPQVSESNDVQYPALNTAETENQLLSPARSENEMSWRVDTPPVAITTARQETIPAPEIPVPVDVSRHEPQEDYSDIWQEEASRSSNSLESAESAPEEAPELQALLAGDGQIKPARGKLPGTWRRKSANHFQYSDETETPQKFTNPNVEPTGSVYERYANEVLEDEEAQNEEAESEASDDTGMFFQHNIPNVFNKSRPTRSQQKDDKQSLSILMKEGESLLPESSPLVAAKTSKSAIQVNPFLDTPPRFTGFPSSPKKSSPLRKELYSVDISSDSPRRVEDESTLPFAQSSPFHTFVDGQSYVSTASDQRQFQVEMEGSTASTIRRVRSEANRYLDAYEPQERSLNEIEEVTELSRTLNQDPSFLPSSPPQRKRTFAQSMISPVRRPVPLFSNPRDFVDAAPSPSNSDQEDTETAETEETSVNEEPVEAIEPNQPGLFSRLTSNLMGAFSRPPPPPPHPILSKFSSLPKIEPWTKTHYKALDRLYTTHLKHPTAFNPSAVPGTPLSQANKLLLDDFLSIAKQPYVGAQFSAWGYSVIMTEELIVLCAVYMQLLTLGSIEEYESMTGKNIQMGDCGPGRSGDAIKGDDVVRRLATVVMGEAVRRDERRGKVIDKSEALTVEWP